jgi:hypothetical protein
MLLQLLLLLRLAATAAAAGLHASDRLLLPALLLL